MDAPLLAALAAAIAPGGRIERGTGAAAIGADSARLEEMLAREGEAAELRLWTNRQCLVTTRRFARLDRFEAAAAASAARGWPVFVRASGGTTVVHRPGILNVSLLMVRRAGAVDIDRGYAGLGRRLVAALAALGVAARVGPVPGSYCDGRHNIVAGARKVAGTACLLRPAGARIGLLAHAAVTVTGDVFGDVAAVACFEADLGLRPAYDAAAHASLAELMRAETMPAPRGCSSTAEQKLFKIL
ncbi:MAG TPA: hypothetical protein PKD99_06195 [Sphingopyxis sp.]|nr:hypothetical protein [Sphingopyxis sp.]HMP44679.1 hypothetical protein [Sphingopyxis sp.]HMQ18138.1 hypothetical protein [Sphingopyxis sp.]